jgi:hypothetical protein
MVDVVKVEVCNGLFGEVLALLMRMRFLYLIIEVFGTLGL